MKELKDKEIMSNISILREDYHDYSYKVEEGDKLQITTSPDNQSWSISAWFQLESNSQPLHDRIMVSVDTVVTFHQEGNDFYMNTDDKDQEPSLIFTNPYNQKLVFTVFNNCGQVSKYSLRVD